MGGMGLEQTWRSQFVMFALPSTADTNGAVTCRLAVGNRRGSISFSWVGLFQEKTKQNQNRIFVLVPRGGIEPPTPAFSVQCSTN